jgi:hypothetical protein
MMMMFVGSAWAFPAHSNTRKIAPKVTRRPMLRIASPPNRRARQSPSVPVHLGSEKNALSSVFAGCGVDLWLRFDVGPSPIAMMLALAHAPVKP